MMDARRSPPAGRALVRTCVAVCLVAGAGGSGAACGSRTELLAPTQGDRSTFPPPGDSFTDDGGPPADALPPVRVTPTSPPNDCPDAAATLIYLITNAGALLSFDPPTTNFRTIGRIACPTSNPADSPNSMAVDRTGVAFVGFQSGAVFRVSTATAACRPTGFDAGSAFSAQFGMGFSSDATGGGETLYLGESTTAGRLAWLDTTGFVLHVIGSFAPAIDSPELTGTGAGDLFAFHDLDNDGGPTAISRVDKTTARVLSQSPLPGVTRGNAWAFAFWGGDFYTFTGPAVGPSTVHRFRPSDGSVATVAETPLAVVGAGVSTCAPQQ